MTQPSGRLTLIPENNDRRRTLHPGDQGQGGPDSSRFKNVPRYYSYYSSIDYFFVSDNLKDKVKLAFIMKEITGSDHCPVGIELGLGQKKAWIPRKKVLSVAAISSVGFGRGG